MTPPFQNAWRDAWVHPDPGNDNFGIGFGGSGYDDAANPTNPQAGVLMHKPVVAAYEIAVHRCEVGDRILIPFSVPQSGQYLVEVRGKTSATVYDFGGGYPLNVDQSVVYTKLHTSIAPGVTPEAELYTVVLPSNVMRVLEAEAWDQFVKAIGKWATGDTWPAYLALMMVADGTLPAFETPSQQYALYLNAELEANAEYYLSLALESDVTSKSVTVLGGHGIQVPSQATVEELVFTLGVPRIGSVVSSPDPVTQGNSLTLIAKDVTDPDGGSIQKVVFYREVSNGFYEELGQDTSAAGGWSWTGTADWPAGSHRYFARAVDNDGNWSPFGPSTTGQVTPKPPQQGNHLSICSTRWDDPDGDEDGIPESRERVQFQCQLKSTANVQNIDAVITSLDSDTAILNNSTYYFISGTGQCQWPQTWFEMDLNFDVLQGQTRSPGFNIHVTYRIGDQPYYQDLPCSPMVYPPHQPASFEICAVSVDDSPTYAPQNNGDGVLQTTEATRLRIGLRNTGSTTATDILASLHFLNCPGDRPIKIQGADKHYPDLSPGGGCWYFSEDRYYVVTSTDVTFSGVVPCTLDLTWYEGSTVRSASVPCPVTVAPAPCLGIDPTEYDFTVVAPGAPVILPLQIRNAGTAPMTVSGATSSNPDTSVDPDACQSFPFVLQPGEPCNLRVTIDTTHISNGSTIRRTVTINSNGRVEEPGVHDTLVVTGLVSDATPVYQITTAAASGSQSVDISDGRIVWVDTRNGPSEVYLYDVRTREERRITTTPSSKSHPRISGNLVVWSDNRNGNYDVFAYDLTPGQEHEFPVSLDAADEDVVGCDGTMVAFTRVYYTSAECGSPQPSNLWLYQLGSPTCANITNWESNTNHDPMPTIWNNDFGGGLLVWSEGAYSWGGTCWSNMGVQTRKLRVGAECCPEAILGTTHQWVAADDDRFAYRRDSGKNQVWLWKAGTSPRQLTTEETDHAYRSLAIGSDFIIYDKWAGTRSLFYWDLKTDREYLLSSQTPSPDYARMDGNAVVWKSSEASGNLYYASSR